jgi:hypothetical protein
LGSSNLGETDGLVRSSELIRRGGAESPKLAAISAQFFELGLQARKARYLRSCFGSGMVSYLSDCAHGHDVVQGPE